MAWLVGTAGSMRGCEYEYALLWRRDCFCPLLLLFYDVVVMPLAVVYNSEFLFNAGVRPACVMLRCGHDVVKN